MFIICEKGVGAKVCYPQGDVLTFGNYEAAMARAVAISSNNPGFCFSVVGWLSNGTEYLKKWCLERDNLTLRRGL